MLTYMETRRKQAKDLANALGIPLYLSQDGRIAQHGPGERFDPPKREPPLPDVVPAVKEECKS